MASSKGESHTGTAIVTPPAPTLFNYAVIFGDRSEWVAFSAPRPFRLAAHDTRDLGQEGASTLFPLIEKPLGAAWTDLARLAGGVWHLRLGLPNDARRLLKEWGHRGFFDLIEWLKPGALQTRDVRSHKAAMDTIGPHNLFGVALIFHMAAIALLLPETEDDDEGLARSPNDMNALLRQPMGRLAALSRFWADPVPAEESEARMDRILKGMRSMLAQPVGHIEQEVFLAPALWKRRADDRVRTRRTPLWTTGLRQAVRDGHLHPKIYFTNSFLALCWLEFWHAVEHNVLYRRCANSDCQRFFVVQRGHYAYCDICRRERRTPLPRERLIRRAMNLLGFPGDKTKVLVAELHKLDQRYIRSKEKGEGWTSGHRHRREELRKMLHIRTRRNRGTVRPQ